MTVLGKSDIIKDTMETVRIKSVAQLAEMAKKLPDEYEWFENIRLEFDDTMDGVQMHFSGQNFDSTLNTSMMKGIIKLQDAIYRQYAIFVYGKPKTLSQEEQRALELYVKIQPGSSALDFIPTDVIKAIAQRVKKMTGKEMIATIAAVSVGATLFMATGKIIDHKAKIKELEAVSETFTGVQKATAEAVIESINAQVNFFKEVSKQTDASSIEVNGETVTVEGVKEITKTPRTVAEIKTELHSGMFMITDIHFKDDAVYLDVVDESGLEIRHVNIFKDMISNDDYQWFKDSANRQKIEMYISTTEKSGKIIGASLVSFKKQN